MPALNPRFFHSEQSEDDRIKQQLRFESFIANRETLKALYELCTAEAWINETRDIRSINVVSDSIRRPASVKSGGNHQWYRLGLESPGTASVTVDVQPIFDSSIIPKGDDPQFVRQFVFATNDYAPGLQLITRESNHHYVFRIFHFPLGLDDVNIDYLGTDIDVTDDSC